MAAKKAGAKRASGAKKSAVKDAAAAPVTAGGSLRGAHETKDGALLPKGAQTGTMTATGQALQERDDVPQGAERGSQLEIAGGDPVADLDNDGGDAQEGQAEPAIYAVNGTVDKNMVPSPSGPVPVAAVASTPEDAQRRLDEHQKTLRAAIKKTSRKLSEDEVARMTRAEISAVAHDRGYDMPEAGARVSRGAFLRAQDEDQYAVEEEA